jgi:hypothetical protein
MYVDAVLSVYTSNFFMRREHTRLKHPISSEWRRRSSPPTLWNMRFDTTTIRLLPFGALPSRIMCMVQSPLLTITTVGCDDGKLRIRSNRRGERRRTPSLEDEATLDLLVANG